MIHVPRSSVNGWTCSWNPRVGRIYEQGSKTIWWPSNAAWMPGMPSLRPAIRGGIEMNPRFSRVDRTPRIHGLSLPLRGTEDNYDGGTQGGGDITNDAPFRGAWSLERMDRKIERHPILAWHFSTGRHLTRDDFGYHDVYEPLRETAFSTVPRQLWPFVCSPSPYNASSLTQRYDPAHGRRPSVDAEAVYRETGDPVAFDWMIALAEDALCRFPLQPIDSGYQSLYTIQHNAAVSPHLAKIGEIRAWAWFLRDLVNAVRIDPDPRYRLGVRMVVQIVKSSQAESGVFCNGTLNDGEPFQRMPWIPHGSASRVLDEDEGCTQVFEEDYLVANLGEAELVMAEDEITRDVKLIVEKWCRRYGSVPLINGAMPKYIVTSKAGRLFPEVYEGIDPGVNQWGGDAVAVAQRLGVAKR